MGAAGCVSEPVDPTDPDPPQEPATGPIRVAAALAQTGRHQVAGIELMQGYELAVRMLNERGGIRGRMVQLTLNDDGSDAETSARLYADFAASGTVDFFLGPYSSSITQVVLPVTEDAGIPLVAAAAAAPEVWAGQGRRWSVQLLTPAPNYLKGAVEVAAFIGARDVALVYENSAFPASVAAGVRERAQAHEMNMVMDAAYEVGAADHEQILTAARDAGATFFVVGGYTEDDFEFTLAAARIGYSPRLMSLTLGPARPDFIEQVGEAGRCVASKLLWDPDAASAGYISDNQTLARRYETEYGLALGDRVVQGFSAVEVLAKAISEVMTDTGAAGREAVRDRLFGVATNTVLGPYSVHPIGAAEAGAQDGLQPLQVQWQDDGTGRLARRVIYPWNETARPC